VLDRERLEGVHRVLKSCVGCLLGVGATDGAGVDLLENGLERIVLGGLLGLNDGREGAADGGRLGVNDGERLGVNDGLDGAGAGALLGLNDGLEGDGETEGARLELNPEPELRDGPGLELGLMASRLAAMLFMVALRFEPARAAITLDIDGKKPDGPRPGSEKPAW